VPEGGQLVAGTPDGASAIAALRFTLAPGESNPVLTLTVADNGDQGGAQAVIAACHAGSAWAGGENGGPWEAKPNAACDAGSVQGLASADGKTWTFALAPLVVDTEVNVVITPGTVAPGAPVTSPFSLAFNRPNPAALVTTQGEVPSEETAGGASADSTEPATLGDTTTPAGVDFGAATAAGSAFQPSLPATSQGLTATAPLVRQATAGNVLPPAATGRSSAIAFVVLLACAAVAVRLNQLPTPDLRRLGPLASVAGRVAPRAAAPAEAGGLGRFARRRTGAPPPLV
jgi:hypothetical protein